MASYYWDSESWGSFYPPENWEEIVNAANSKIDEYIEKNNLDPDDDRDDDEIRNYSSYLWEIWVVQNKFPEEVTEDEEG